MKQKYLWLCFKCSYVVTMIYWLFYVECERFLTVEWCGVEFNIFESFSLTGGGLTCRIHPEWIETWRCS